MLSPQSSQFAHDRRDGVLTVSKTKASLENDVGGIAAPRISILAAAHIAGLCPTFHGSLSAP